MAGTQTASLTGALTVTGDIEITLAPTLDLAGSQTAALGGILSATGDLQYTLPVDLAASAAALSGSLSVTGDLEYSTAIFLDIAAQPIALAGTFSASGDLDPYPSLDLAGSRTAALSGSVTVTGDLQSVVPFELAFSASTALAGVVSVTGDLQFSTEPIEQPSGGDGENYGPIGRGSIVHRITARRDLVARQVRPSIGDLPQALPLQDVEQDIEPITVAAVIAARQIIAMAQRPRGMVIVRETPPQRGTLPNFCSHCGARIEHVH